MEAATFSFWDALDRLVDAHEIVIDRARGSTHPRYPDLIYPFDYGYLQGTQSPDGGGIDLWRGSLTGRHACGVICTIDLLKNGAEIKVLIDCTMEDAQIILRVHNTGLQSGLLYWR